MSVGSTSSSSSSGAASLVINGLISGISTQAVIQALLQSYEAPITNLQNEQATLNQNAADYKTVNSDMQAVLNAAQALNTPNSWNLMTATTSDSAVATATSSPGAQGGTLNFTVNNLAAGNLLLSSGGVSSTSASITDADSALIGVGGQALGFVGLSGNGLTLGAHDISVTQASQSATVAGSSAPGAATNIQSGTNDTIALSVNNQSYNLTLAAGMGYTAADLVAAINTAAGAQNAPITASLNSNGEIQLATNEQGSAATLQITGGDALSSLGMAAGSAVTGANAVVQVDGTTTTLTAVNAGGTVTLNAPTGTITATVASSAGASGSLLSAGSATATEISTGSGSLADVVSAINAAGVGATASAIHQSNGTYRLQVAADSTGLSGAVSLDSNLSGGAIGAITTATAAADASVSVGGANGYTLESSTNTFTNMLAGTAVTVASEGSATITVASDAAGEANKVNTLVTAANQALSDIQTVSGYNETTKTGGPLMGSAVLNNIKQAISSIFSGAAGTSGLGDGANVGITLNANGTLSFSQSTFESAFNADPQKVASLFTQDGTFAPSSSSPNGSAQLVYAGNHTVEGAYAVSISQSAAQALDTGATLSGGAVSAAETLTITSGGAQATYQVNAGESLTSIANGLNAVFASEGLELGASVNSAGTALQLTSDSYGSSATFTVSSSAGGTAGTTGLGGSTANTPASFVGTDVAGTINGAAATGTGQLLTASVDDTTLNGLSLLVATPNISSATDLGTFTYTPGLAQQLVSIADSASNAETGSLTTAASGLTNEATGLNQQISMYQSFASAQQSVLENEFVKMETALGQAKNEGSALSSQINQLT